MKKGYIGGLTLVALAFGTWGAAVPPGFDAASFTRFGVGPQPLAMGGAMVAAPTGPSAGYWNPAGLASLEGLQAEGTYLNLFGVGVHTQYLGLGSPLPIRRSGEEAPLRPSLGVALLWLSTQVADILWGEDGIQSTFDAWSHALLLAVGWAPPWLPSGALGLTVKLYHDRILEGKSVGVGADLGLLVTLADGKVPLVFGVALYDVGGTVVQWTGTTGNPVNHVPWLARLGVSGRLSEAGLTWGISYEWGLDQPRLEQLRLGGELTLEWFSLRVGWIQPLFGDHGCLSAGLGIRPWRSLSVDYVFFSQNLGVSHIVGARLSL